MDSNCTLHIVERHRRQQPRQTEKMVAMQVRYEYVGYFGKRAAVAAELQLSAFAAIAIL